MLHREIHVWIYNKEREILFQKRSLNKDTFPGLLDASVGGHVELGSNYEETATKETKEETGIIIDKNQLVEVTKTKSKSYDKVTGMTNNTFRMVYVYEYNGSLNDLKIEKEKATSLEFWPLDKILNLSEKEKKQFIPTILKKEFIFKKIKEMIENNLSTDLI